MSFGNNCIFAIMIYCKILFGGTTENMECALCHASSTGIYISVFFATQLVSIKYVSIILWQLENLALIDLIDDHTFLDKYSLEEYLMVYLPATSAQLRSPPSIEDQPD